MRYRVVRGDSVCCVGALGGEKAQVENSGKGVCGQSGVMSAIVVATG